MVLHITFFNPTLINVKPVIRPFASSPLVHKPTITQYDQWGRRIDTLYTSEGWRKLKAIAQREGIPAIFYERQYGEHSRVYGFAKVLLMVGDTHEVFCPLSMTDGAARTLELADKGPDIFKRLIRSVYINLDLMHANLTLHQSKSLRSFHCRSMDDGGEFHNHLNI